MNEQNNLNTSNSNGNNFSTSDGVPNSISSDFNQENSVPPCASEEVEVISTVNEKKKTSLAPLFIILIIIIVGVYKVDDIIKYFNKPDTPIVNNNTSNNNNDDDDVETNNLVDGFIVINDNTSYIKINKIKFYNFKKSSTKGIITLNYLSDLTYEDVKPFGIYVEFYSAQKEFLYRQLFDASVVISSIKTYSVSMPVELYESAKYAKARKIDEKEKNSVQKLVCSLTDSGQGYELLYKNTFNFKNNELQNYEVHKEINISVENTTNRKILSQLESENNDILASNIETRFINNELDYVIDVTKDLVEFEPLYDYKTVLAIIREKETQKKWICE